MPRRAPPGGKKRKRLDVDREKMWKDFLQEHRKRVLEDPSYLNDAVKYNPDLRLHPDHRYIAADLFHELGPHQGYKIRQKILDVEILLANMLDRGQKGWIHLSMSKNADEWTTKRFNRTSRFTVDAIRLLEKAGYVHMRLGYRIPDNPKESRRTRIMATDKLLEKYPRRNFRVISEPKELVEVKRNDKLFEGYKETKRCRQVRATLERVNAVNALANIRLGYRPLSISLKAIFINKRTQYGFAEYGRLHTSGAWHYQRLDKEERSEITINGEPVVELDFRALHPRLLYAEEGIQYPDDKDPYSVVDDKEWLRPLLKTMYMALQNNGVEIKACKAVSNWIRTKTEPSEREQLAALGITQKHETLRPLLEKMRKVHEPISKHLLSEQTALRIMNKDAEIALDIVGRFAEMNIPILAIHDSFIVQSRYERKLRRTMKAAYAKATKSKSRPEGFTCPIH